MPTTASPNGTASDQLSWMSNMTSVIMAPITKPTIAPTMPPSHTIRRRLSGRRFCPKLNRSRSGESLREPSEHREVGVKLNPRQIVLGFTCDAHPLKPRRGVVLDADVDVERPRHRAQRQPG